MKTVGIIGGSGFIGSHITKRFLEEGYAVKVSATDLSKAEKYRHLKLLPGADKLEIAPLKVENKLQLERFIEGCEIVIHGGTPFQLEFNDPKSELLDPTIRGTENFLNVIHENGKVNKVVFIASVGAFNTNFPLPANGKAEYDKVSERTERFISEESHPYAQAKFMANRTVQKFIADHPHPAFEISSVSPTMVMGKSLSKREDSTSTGMQFLIKNHIAPNDFMQALYDNDVALAIVDVKDVAEAIFRLATTSGLHGKDYLLSSETYSISDVRSMLNNLKPKKEGKMVYENLLAMQDLKINFRPVAETLKN